MTLLSTAPGSGYSAPKIILLLERAREWEALLCTLRYVFIASGEVPWKRSEWVNCSRIGGLCLWTKLPSFPNRSKSWIGHHQRVTSLWRFLILPVDFLRFGHFPLVETDRSLGTKYSIMVLILWQASAIKYPQERGSRMEYLCRRIWHIARKKKQVSYSLVMFYEGLTRELRRLWIGEVSVSCCFAWELDRLGNEVGLLVLSLPCGLSHFFRGYVGPSPTIHHF